VRPLLALLAKLRGLRGTPLDVFGYSAERRIERQLAADYGRRIEALLRTLRVETLDTAVELASLPSSIRGYGHVKLASIEAARKGEAELLAGLREPAEARVPLAAD
jgi:indolepyruvate ferredoxin oxidoreductase